MLLNIANTISGLTFLVLYGWNVYKYVKLLRDVIICFVNWLYANSFMGILVNITISFVYAFCLLFSYLIKDVVLLILICGYQHVLVNKDIHIVINERLFWFLLF